ncbi:mitochondrial inner membrane protease atp23 [Lophium mytilinum]|uniref:Mitochondrial inner membrane protease ATP23 n=1 Tax=Lophium mytilinum TaxID=390894 RepID=A0A6A6QBB1_9PEZI|nr:mitochondrial inner membrane protease atp23 [Lophium mytilinum]
MTDSTNASPPQRTTEDASPNPSDLDPSFYTWSTLFTLLAGGGKPGDRDRYIQIRDTVNEERDCKKCESYRDYLLKYSPTVTFLQSEVAKLGGNLHAGNIHCKRCTESHKGGINPKVGILLCSNHMKGRSHLEDTLSHELVHAWDYLRFKIDETNLRHQACTEIRASTLSGECRFTREFFGKSQFNITQQLQECVRRRATLSIKARPECKDDVHAAKVVNEVWDSCFSDTRPFDEIYR